MTYKNNTLDFGQQNFAFENILVEPNANSIVIFERRKRIEPKVVQLLCFLAEHSGEVLSREQIMDQVWPGIVVGDEAVNRTIFALRLALGDDAKQPRFIETVPKRGYRFLCEVEMVNSSPGVSCWWKNSYAKYSVLALCSIFLAVTVGIGVLLNKKTNWVVGKVLPYTQTVGEELDPNIHAESGQLAYVYIYNWQPDLYIRNTLDGHEIRITNDDWYELSPLWLDKDTLLYIRCLQNHCQIMRTVIGDKPHVVFESKYELNDLALADKLIDDSRGPWILFSERKNDSETDLVSLNLINGKKKVFQEEYLGFPKLVRKPSYLREHNALLFVDDDGVSSGLKQIRLDDSEILTVSDAFDSIDDVLSIDGGNNIFIAGTLSGNHGIWHLDQDGMPTQMLRASIGEHIRELSFNSNNNTILFESSLSHFDLGIVSKAHHDGLHKLNSNANEKAGVFGPDGKNIYFFSERNGYKELWEYDTKSEKTEQLTQLNASFITRPEISMSGRYAAFSYQKGGVYLAILDLESKEVISSLETKTVRYPLSWSDDESNLYASEIQNQRNLFRYNRMNLEETLIQKNAGLYAKEHEGSKALYYINFKNDALERRDIASSDVRVLARNIPHLSELHAGQLKVSDEGVYAIDKRNKHRALFFYPFKGEARELFKLPDYLWVSDIDQKNERVILHNTLPPWGDLISLHLEK